MGRALARPPRKRAYGPLDIGNAACFGESLGWLFEFSKHKRAANRLFVNGQVGRVNLARSWPALVSFWAGCFELN